MHLLLFNPYTPKPKQPTTTTTTHYHCSITITNYIRPCVWYLTCLCAFFLSLKQAVLAQIQVIWLSVQRWKGLAQELPYSGNHQLLWWVWQWRWERGELGRRWHLWGVPQTAVSSHLLQLSDREPLCLPVKCLERLLKLLFILDLLV